MTPLGEDQILQREGKEAGKREENQRVQKQPNSGLELCGFFPPGKKCFTPSSVLGEFLNSL